MIPLMASVVAAGSLLYEVGQEGVLSICVGFDPSGDFLLGMGHVGRRWMR